MSSWEKSLPLPVLPASQTASDAEPKAGLEGIGKLV